MFYNAYHTQQGKKKEEKEYYFSLLLFLSRGFGWHFFRLLLGFFGFFDNFILFHGLFRLWSRLFWGFILRWFII